MKAIVVPSNPVSKKPTMVIQLTLPEAQQLLEVYEWSVHFRGFQPDGYHYIKEFVESFKQVAENEQKLPIKG